MSRFTTVVLLAITIAFAASMPVAAQPRANLVVAVPPPVSAYDVSARNMVRLRAYCYTYTGSCVQSMQSELTGPYYVVPTGKRLVITGYSGALLLPTGSSAPYADFINDPVDTLTVFPDFHLTITNYQGSDYYVTNGITTFYVDQGELVTVGVITTAHFMEGEIFAWGYLVDCTGGVCTKG